MENKTEIGHLCNDFLLEVLSLLDAKSMKNAALVCKK